MEAQNEHYAGSMYTFLYGMQQFEDMSWGMKNGHENENDNVARALIETRHEPLIQMILDFEHDDHKSFCEAVVAYNDHEEYETLAQVLLKYAKKHSCLPFREMMKKLAVQPDNDDLIKKFAQYAAIEDNRGHSLFSVREVVRILFEAKRYDLAMEIAKTYLSKKELPFMEIIRKLSNDEEVTSEQISKAFTTCMPLSEEKRKHDYFEAEKNEEPLTYFMNRLFDTGASLELIEIGIREFEARRSMDQVNYFSNSWDPKFKIMRAKIAAGDFDGAEEFLDSCDLNYGREEIYEARLKYLIETNDKKKHEKQLQKTLKLLKNSIDTAVHNADVKNESNVPQKGEWSGRISYYKLKAEFEAEQAIYEHIHGDVKKAQEYIKQMIHWINQIIVTPEGKECPEQHMKTFKKRKKSAKRSIRLKFQNLGLLHILPKLEGWSDKIGATEEQRAESRKKSKHHRRARYVELTEEEYAEQQRINEFPHRKAIKTALGKSIGAAIKELKKMVQWQAGSAEWKRGEMILDVDPHRFHQLFEILSQRHFSRDNFRMSRRRSQKELAEFVLKGLEYGVIDEAYIDELSEKWQQTCWTPDGARPLPYYGVTTLLNGLLEQGRLKLAIKFFKDERTQNYMSRNLLVKCLAIFIRHASKNIDNVRCGAKFAFKDGQLPEDATNEEKTEYWNSEIERLIATKQEGYDEAFTELMKQMNDVDSVRTLTRLMALGSMRTNHQKKDALLGAYKKQEDQLEVRYAIVESMIENQIPGAVSLPEIKSKNTPFAIAVRFFTKLVETKVLHKHTLNYLNKDDLPYLRRLLSQYQNQFNTIMETIEKKFRFNKKKKISSLEWERIFFVLQLVGVITPGIYAEAEASGFDKKELLKIKEKMDALKERMFINKNIEDDEVTPELMAESIYIAYQPANMRLSTVKHLCEAVQDCTHHLDKYNFPLQGFPLDLKSNKIMKIKRGAVIETPPRIYNPRKLKDKLLMSDHRRKQIRALCDLGNFKFNNVDLSDVLVVFKNNAFFRETMKEWREVQSDDQQYRALRRLQETLGIFLEDNLESALVEFIKNRMQFASKMIENFVKGLKKKGKRQALKNQLGLEINGENDVELAAKVIAKVFLQKYKPLADIRKKINNDSKKFLTADGEEVADTDLRLRAVISKNKASFFAKASAGICTAENVDLFNREDHFHINLVDEDEKRCVGNIQAYIMPYKGKKYLLMRGFNPSTKVLKEVDVDNLCEAIIDVGRQFVHDNDLEGVMVSEQGGFLALSNRPEVKDYVQRTYRSHSIEIPGFEISNGYKIKNVYIVDDRPKKAFQPREFNYVEEMLVGESMIG